MAPLSLRIIASKGAVGTLQVDSEVDSSALRQKVQEHCAIAAKDQALFFQNGSRNAAKIPIEDSKTLAEQGVEDGAVITVRVGEKVVLPQDSKLRQSIDKNGGSSYYYAHANESELPKELRYVYGGEPAKLNQDDAAATGTQQEGQDATPPTQAIQSYSWADEGDFVCIYVGAEGEPAAIEAAGAGKADEVSVKFEAKSVELWIHSATRSFALLLKNLENEIVPSESKTRVSAGKRVTIKLKKKRAVAWTRLLRPK